MNPRPLRLLPALLLLLAPAAPAQRTTHFVWVLDAGNQSNPSPVIRIYDPEGTEITTVSVPGSAQARGLDFGPDGSCWVCRGSAVHQLDRMGTPTGIVLAPPVSGVPAMDVLAMDDGQIFVGWGTNAGNSRIARYDSAGMLLEDITDMLLDHPRRIAADRADSSRLYVANRGASELLFFDDIPGMPTFGLASDLGGGAIGPVGLAYDATRDAVWVAGDWGQTQEIGYVDVSASPSAFTTAINYGSSIMGLEAPSGLAFDRFRRLWVSGRSSNSGTPGVYVFDASAGTMPVQISTFPVAGPAPVNVIDVALQPLPVTTCVPLEMGTDEPILAAGAANEIRLEAPDFAGALYFAALSLPWPASCPPGFVPGQLAPELTFPSPETRGLPASFDCLFWLTAGVGSLFDPPFLGPAQQPASPCFGLPVTNITDFPGFGVQGFRGFLDGSGMATATVFLPPDPGGVLDGIAFSFTWMTFDPASVQHVGLVANATCVTIRSNPAGVITCP